jgi:hypothetical protein
MFCIHFQYPFGVQRSGQVGSWDRCLYWQKIKNKIKVSSKSFKQKIQTKDSNKRLFSTLIPNIYLDGFFALNSQTFFSGAKPDSDSSYITP